MNYIHLILLLYVSNILVFVVLCFCNYFFININYFCCKERKKLKYLIQLFSLYDFVISIPLRSISFLFSPSSFHTTLRIFSLLKQKYILEIQNKIYKIQIYVFYILQTKSKTKKIKLNT